MPLRFSSRAIILSLGLISIPSALAENFPPPAPTPPEQSGLGIQRTMQLLAGSSPEHHNKVRILFYGQSITEQAWSSQVADYLRRAYPDAFLTIENRAIGGHSSQLLVKTAEADLYPFQPDLLIFHVYGAHDKYEDIIRSVREKTCAEVLIQTDHLSADQSVDEPTDPAKVTMKEWTQWFNYAFLPSLHDKYQVDIVPQRDVWKQYLRRYDLKPSDLLKDGVHLNNRGEYVMAEIVKSQLVVHPEISPPAARRVVKESVDPSRWKAGPEGSTLEFPFEGNRIDAVLGGPSGNPEVVVKIDGKAPSEIPECYAFTRVTGYNRTSWPCLLRASRGATPLQAETWTITLSNATEDYSHFHFALSGSKTGPDGEGEGTGRFVSKSGRIVIEPDDWNLAYSQKVFKVPHPADVPITFQSIPLSVDRFSSHVSHAFGIENTVTLASNLAPGKHVLTLQTATGSSGVAALRVYNPQAK